MEVSHKFSKRQQTNHIAVEHVTKMLGSILNAWDWLRSQGEKETLGVETLYHQEMGESFKVRISQETLHLLVNETWNAWDDFVNNLDHRANYSVFRGFTRKMLGNGFTPGLVRSLILLPSGISLSFRRKNVACLSISFTSIIQHAFEPTITSHGSCK